MRPRISVSNGSFQLSKRWPTVSFCGSEESAFVVALVMAWSPVRRVNAGRFEVKHPGDYATFNSNHSRDTTPCPAIQSSLRRLRTLVCGAGHHVFSRRNKDVDRRDNRTFT